MQRRNPKSRHTQPRNTDNFRNFNHLFKYCASQKHLVSNLVGSRCGQEVELLPRITLGLALDGRPVVIGRAHRGKPEMWWS